jgi:hypothetical protein
MNTCTSPLVHDTNNQTVKEEVSKLIPQNYYVWGKAPKDFQYLPIFVFVKSHKETLPNAFKFFG